MSHKNCLSTGADAGVFHVANLLPFRTWDTETVPTGGYVPESSADDNDDVPDVMHNDATSITLNDLQFENGDNCPVSTSVHDQSGSVDSVNSLSDIQAEFVTQNDDLAVGSNDPNRCHYDLRPRHTMHTTQTNLTLNDVLIVFVFY